MDVFMTKFLNFWKRLFKGAIQDQLSIIMPLAREAITAVASDPSIIASDAKRSAAFAIIMGKLAAQEVNFAARMINLAIEIAVIEFKGISDES
jgi:hypothetical protein